MGHSFRAARVYQTTTLKLNNVFFGRDAFVPPWFEVMGKIPPTEILTRPRPTTHQDPDPRKRRPRRTYIPERITFPEDALRRTFFKDHPWELARPRVIVETDGKDAYGVDWSKGLRQPGRQVTGESVVQRQMWLMENGKTDYVENQATGGKEAIQTPLSTEQAYDIARAEFYAIRQEEQIEKRIAKEEAQMVGAYFGKDRLQISMELEDKTFEKWKVWAEKQTMLIQAKKESAYSSFSDEADESQELDVLDMAVDGQPEKPGSAALPAVGGRGPSRPMYGRPKQ